MPSREVKYFLSALLVYAGLLTPLWLLVDHFDVDMVVINLELASAVSFYYYWRITPWGGARYTSFGSALLIFGIVFRCLAILNSLVFGIDNLSWPSTLPVYSSFSGLFIRGEMITQLGYLLTITAWRMAVGDALGRLSLPHINFRGMGRSKLLGLYGGGLVVMGLFRTQAVDFAGLTQLVGGVLFLGVAAIYLYSSEYARPLKRLTMAFMLALPLTLAAMNSGMKEEIYMPLVPSFMIFWRDFRSILLRGVLVVVALGMLAIGQLYAGYVRDTVWRTWVSQSPAQIVQNVYDNINPESLTLAMADGLNRTNYSVMHAITTAVVDLNGFNFGETYAQLPIVFIPRLLWPDKPSIQPGAAHTRLIEGSSVDLSEMNTSTAAGLYTEMYLGGGYTIMMLSAIFYGALVGKLQLWVLRRLPPLGTALMAYKLFYNAFRLDELSVLYAYNGIILFTLTLWLAMRLLYLKPQPGRRGLYYPLCSLQSNSGIKPNILTAFEPSKKVLD